MRDRIKKFSKSRRILFVYTEGIKRFNKSRFKSRKVKRRATSNKNKKFVVVIVKSALGVVKMLTNGEFVKLLWASVALQERERLWRLCEVGGLTMDLGTCCLIRSSKH